jgi:hypothetical protein
MVGRSPNRNRDQGGLNPCKDSDEGVRSTESSAQLNPKKGQTHLSLGVPVGTDPPAAGAGLEADASLGTVQRVCCRTAIAWTL